MWLSGLGNLIACRMFAFEILTWSEHRNISEAFVIFTEAANQRSFIKKPVLKNFAILTVKHLC